MQHFGIDFGSRSKGTTAVCYEEAGRLLVRSSTVGGDADAFILQMAAELRPDRIFIDAPLSLPLAYFRNAADDYMYREADRQLSAMSPMFLGGLTARAIRLKHELGKSGIEMFESYPKAVFHEVFRALPDRKSGKEELPKWTALVGNSLPLPMAFEPADWHQVDAAACWLSGYRYAHGLHRTVGDPEEGCIII